MRSLITPALFTPINSSARLLLDRLPMHSLACLCFAAVLAGCAANKPSLDPVPEPSPHLELPEAPKFEMPADKPVLKIEPKPVSQATTAKQYRRDAAQHLYGLNEGRIFKGKLPPLIHAVGVLTLQLDKMGNIEHLHWNRAPAHAPNVVKEIERTVRAAAPYPAPVHMGGVVYTDIWLWDRTDHFQLDTLTEGQRRK